MICPCGVDQVVHPHYSRICAPTLPERLRNMREWLVEKGSRHVDITETYVWNTPNGWINVTAFPYADRFQKSCIQCEYILNPNAQHVVIIGNIHAFKCGYCFFSGETICPRTLEFSKICARTNLLRQRALDICLMHHGICKDLRKVICRLMIKCC